jgi:hypothetical protein
MQIPRQFGLVHGFVAIIFLALLGWTWNANAYSSLTSSENSVTVDVRPIQLRPSQPAEFEVRMNTHSVDLSQDMVSVSTLKDDQGRDYQPVAWKGSGPGGHHRKGVLEFPVIDGSSKSVKLTIRNVADVPERTFEWKIEPK